MPGVLILILLGFALSASAQERPEDGQAVESPSPPPSPSPEPSATPAPTTAAETEPTEEPAPRVVIHKRLVQFTVGALSAGAATAKFQNAKITTGGKAYPAEIDFAIDPAAGVILEVRKVEANRWGFQVGLEYEAPRNVSSITIKTPTASITSPYSGIQPKEHSTVLYGNLAYRWDNFYLPFGFNLAFTSIDASADSIIVVPGIGAQLGIGWAFSDLFSLELVSHAEAISDATETASTYFATYGSGYISDVRLFGKFSF